MSKTEKKDKNTQKLEDFYWSYTDEPHASRRKAILAKHPEIRQLFGFDPNTKYFVTTVVICQIFIAYLLRESSWLTLLACGWTFGGGINHYLNLAIHEITHNLAFEKPLHNRLFSMFVANLPLGLASTITFQKYHMDHHNYQGVNGIDMDIPSILETRLFTNPLSKTLFIFLQPYFYILRPLLMKPKPIGLWECFNWAIQISFNLSVIYFFSFKAFAYLIFSTFLGLGLHPMTGHFIAEHYVFEEGHETYSYYGPLNIFALNVGYHNEHHDFPRIPGSRLPLVRKMAPEFYDNLPRTESWVGTLWHYITDSNIGPYARVKRPNPALQTSSSNPNSTPSNCSTPDSKPTITSPRPHSFSEIEDEKR
jgi:sphingolipid delta-4 desaturase